MIILLLFSFVSVFDILLQFHETEEWRFTLETCIPPCKRLVVKRPYLLSAEYVTQGKPVPQTGGLRVLVTTLRYESRQEKEAIPRRLDHLKCSKWKTKDSHCLLAWRRLSSSSDYKSDGKVSWCLRQESSFGPFFTTFIEILLICEVERFLQRERKRQLVWLPCVGGGKEGQQSLSSSTPESIKLARKQRGTRKRELCK